MCFALAIILFLPIPLGNMMPALAISCSRSASSSATASGSLPAQSRLLPPPRLSGEFSTPSSRPRFSSSPTLSTERHSQ
ncbi:MAG: hypothetical protein ACXW3U_10400 [Rhodoplanes sp.]